MIIEVLSISLLLCIVISTFFLLRAKKLQEENIRLATQIEERDKSFTEKVEFFNDIKAKMNADFKELSADIIKTNTEKLNAKNLETISPLKEQLTFFKQSIENINTEQLKDRALLIQQIKSLQMTNQETKDSAQNLANALTSDNKFQGSWGEMVLSRILSNCGLREGYEFTTQPQHKDIYGNKFIPDVVVHLPQEKDIIIDAKVSLKDYVDYIADNSNKQALDRHIKSLENHIKNISIKEYENLTEVKTLDFIFVFVPIESALWTAIENKKSLFDDCLKKNIMLVSPSTLTMSLKTINYIWQTEKQHKNAKEIARQAGAMYDDLARFVDEMDNIDKYLDKAKEANFKAKKKLSTGKGNLLGRADKLKKFGVKTKKEINE